MTREEKIKFIIKAIDEIEGVLLTPEYFKDYSDENLDKEVERCDYLLDK